MSLKLMIRVMEEVDVTRPEWTVLLAMADHADDEGKNCYPSVNRIAWKCQYKPRNVIYVIRDLQKKGILELVAEAAGHRAAEYAIHLEMAPKKPEYIEWLEGNGRVRGVQSHAEQLSDANEPGVQSHAVGVQSPVTGVQSHADFEHEIAPEPSYEPSIQPIEPPGGVVPTHEVHPDLLGKSIFEEAVGNSTGNSSNPTGKPKPTSQQGSKMAGAKKSGGRSGMSGFQPPTIEAATDEFERKFRDHFGQVRDPEAMRRMAFSWAEDFMLHYSTVGWKVGRNPMKNWHMAVAKWFKRNIDDGKHLKPINRNGILGGNGGNGYHRSGGNYGGGQRQQPRSPVRHPTVQDAEDILGLM